MPLIIKNMEANHGILPYEIWQLHLKCTYEVNVENNFTIQAFV